MNDLESEASDDGIDTFDTIRKALIAWRNDSLTHADFDHAVLLSHAIWWMSALKERS